MNPLCWAMRQLGKRGGAVLLLLGLAVPSARAQDCAQAAEIEAGARAAIDQAATRMIQFAARGDAQNLRESSVPQLASDFGGVQQAVTHDRGRMGEQITIRRDYQLDASKATAPIARAEFFCGVYGATGHTSSSASFVFNNLAPGRYALVLANADGGTVPYMVSVVLQQVQGEWRLAGYYPKPREVAGHDASWFVRQARRFRLDGQGYNAWFYYVMGWEIYAPVDFMSSLQLDKLSTEIQQARPAEVPDGDPVPLAAGNGKSYRMTQLFAAPDDAGELSLVVKYEAADVSDTARALQDNMAVIHAVAARFPEVRTAFHSIVARATTSSGQDYGTLLPMSQLP